MATLAVVLSAFESIQARRTEREISALTSKDRITISATNFLSFAGVTDVVQQKNFVTFIKTSKAAKLFRYLCNLDYCNNPGGIDSVFNFNLTVLPAELEKVRIQSGTAIISPQTSGSSKTNRDSGYEADIVENLELKLKAVIAPDKEKSLAPVMRRKSKKEYYSKKTLDKYASELERDILELIDSKNLSKNENLQNELLNDVLKRIGNRVGSNEAANISNRILSNIRGLIKDMREHGVNDIEQMVLGRHSSGSVR